MTRVEKMARDATVEVKQTVEAFHKLKASLDAIDNGAAPTDIHHAGHSDTGEKKKKIKKKPMKHQIELEMPGRPVEDEDTRKFWDNELRTDRPKVYLPTTILPRNQFKELDIFRTPSCITLKLITPRLILRQVSEEDLSGIIKIKTDPIVQKTQLYGKPNENDCKTFFLNRYVRSSIPRASSGIGNNPPVRQDYIFAITLKEPEKVILEPKTDLSLKNRLKDASGYIGNIALSLEISNTSNLSPRPKKVFTWPTFDQCNAAELKGKLFYEIHQQLWGKGIMSEAFEEILRFAMEEVGCKEVMADPTTTNEASIKLCQKNGLKYSHTHKNNPWNKPQMYHKISRKAWFAKYRAGNPIRGLHDGKLICRWCINPQAPTPAYRCSGCDWALYCSRECQRADWMSLQGHESECIKRSI